MTSKQLFLNIIVLLLLQICYHVLHSGARARGPARSRSASVTIATAVDQTAAPIWLPKGNCSSQAVAVCAASRMSDKHILTQSFVTLASPEETSVNYFYVFNMKAVETFSACEIKSPQVYLFTYAQKYLETGHPVAINVFFIIPMFVLKLYS